MDKRINISKELMEISPVLGKIDRKTPYEAPAGYFEGLADAMLQKLRQEEGALPSVLERAKENSYEVPAGYFENLPGAILSRLKASETGASREVPEAISPLLSGLDKKPLFSVPGNYFETLADAILQKIRQQEETLPPVLGSAKANPYEAPAGYFENLAGSILSRIKAGSAGSPKEELEALSPLLSKLDKRTPFSLPENYFEDLTDNAVAGAQAIEFVNEELENPSPLLEGLKDRSLYEVPAGYFEQLPGRLLKKVGGTEQTGKLVSINFRARVIRYAAAAVVTGALLASGLLYLNRGGGKAVQPTDQVAQVTSPGALAGIEKKIEQVSDKDLQDYLENDNITVAGSGVVNNTVDSDEMDQSDMKAMLADVSDAELQHYLEQNIDYKEPITN